MDEDIASRKRTRSASPTTVIGPTTELPQKWRNRSVKNEGDEKVHISAWSVESRDAEEREETDEEGC
jgi:hypothetical protein